MKSSKKKSSLANEENQELQSERRSGNDRRIAYFSYIEKDLRKQERRQPID